MEIREELKKELGYWIVRQDVVTFRQKVGHQGFLSRPKRRHIGSWK